MNKHIIKLTLLAFALNAGMGCKKFLNVNDNVNSSTATNSMYVMAGALGNTYRNQVSANMMMVPGTWTGLYGHSTSFTGGGSEKTYSFTNADFNAFDGLYNNLSDYRYVMNNAEKDGVSFLVEPASVMQCYVFQTVVDLYGDVPYVESFGGLGNITPKYTAQKVIYEDLVVRLDTAIARMKRATWTTDPLLVAQDIFLKGDRDKWIRFANTVKLRILMRQSFMAGRDSYITENLQRTLGDGYLLENVFCSPGYQNIGGKLNPFYASYGYNEINTVQTGHQYRKMNRVIINWLKNSEDTFRLKSLAWPRGATPNAPSENLAQYVGVPLGAGSGYSNSGSSPIGPFQVKQGEGIRPGIFMTLAEAFFLRAEAAVRYGVVFPEGDAQSLYEQGIRAHYRLCAAPASVTGSADADDFARRYIQRPIENVNWSSSPDKVRAILIQKWVSLCHVNGLEAWSEYRKSSGSASVGVPASVKSTVVDSGDPEPVRYFYPQTEENANGHNTPKNINAFTSRIFWDIN